MFFPHMVNLDILSTIYHSIYLKKNVTTYLLLMSFQINGKIKLLNANMLKNVKNDFYFNHNYVFYIFFKDYRKMRKGIHYSIKITLEASIFRREK